MLKPGKFSCKFLLIFIICKKTFYLKVRIKFILNNESIDTEVNPALVLLDFIRSKRLTGTKEGCKEGDCGACTVLVGELKNDEIVYNSINSCLIPLNNVSKKHIVTIEGLNLSGKNLNPLQQAFVTEGASQCGFCTPGFIVSLTGFFLNEGRINYYDVIDSLDGNICRCTGHNSIIRAAEKISTYFKDAINTNGTRMKFLTDNKIVPEYFLTIKSRLQKFDKDKASVAEIDTAPEYFISGGTDLFVQKPEEMLSSNVKFLNGRESLNGIKTIDNKCILGSETSVTDLLESEIINKIFPSIKNFSELFGSTPIRNSATIGGNINNASPIGDMTALFMSLNSDVTLSDGKKKRKIPLDKFFKSYKVTERKPAEFLESVEFEIPSGNYFFNFEKVSKRTYLDIASVNSAILIFTENGKITNAGISAGGVSAVPLYLSRTSEFLKDSKINIDTIKKAVSIAASEISPISDARGSADYKKLLLTRLIYSHFVTLFPELINIEQTV